MAKRLTQEEMAALLQPKEYATEGGWEYPRRREMEAAGVEFLPVGQSPFTLSGAFRGDPLQAGSVGGPPGGVSFQPIPGTQPTAAVPPPGDPLEGGVGFGQGPPPGFREYETGYLDPLKKLEEGPSPRFSPEPGMMDELARREPTDLGFEVEWPTRLLGPKPKAPPRQTETSAEDRNLGMMFLGLGMQQQQAARGAPSRYERWGGMITSIGGLLRMTGGSKVGTAIAMVGTLVNMYGQRQSAGRRADLAKGWSNALANALTTAERRYSG